MNTGRDDSKENAEEKVIATFEDAQYALYQYANQNKYDLTQCDLIEEMFLRILGINLDKTPTLFCVFGADKTDQTRFVFSVVFSTETMTALGGLAQFRQTVHDQLNTLSSELKPENIPTYMTHQFTLDRRGHQDANIRILITSVTADGVISALMPKMIAMLDANPDLVKHYQRFFYSSEKVYTAFQTQAELALDDWHFDDKMNALTRAVLANEMGEKMRAFINRTFPDEDVNADGFPEKLKYRFINDGMTLDNEAFQELLIEQHIPVATDQMTARKQELFVIVGLAIFLQIKENLETPALLLANTTAVKDFPTVLNPLIFEYLNILLPTETTATTLEPEDTISFSIDTKNQHSNINLPETNFSVPTSIAANVVTLFNRHHKNSARILSSAPIIQNAASSNGEEEKKSAAATSTVTVTLPKTCVVSIDNSRLVEPSFLSDVRHMLSLFSDKTLKQHRIQLDPALNQFIRTVKRLLQQEHMQEDLQKFYFRGMLLQNTLKEFIDHLILTRVSEAHQKLRAWAFVKELELYCQDSKREAQDAVFDVTKCADSLVRKEVFIHALTTALANISSQFDKHTLIKLQAGNRQQLLRDIINLQVRLVNSLFYQFPANNNVRSEMNQLIHTVQDFLNHFIDNGFSQEDEMRRLTRAISNKAHMLKVYSNHVPEHAAKMAKDAIDLPEPYKKIYHNPDLRSELALCRELFDAAQSLEHRIYAPAEGLEQEDNDDLYMAAALMFI